MAPITDESSDIDQLAPVSTCIVQRSSISINYKNMYMNAHIHSCMDCVDLVCLSCGRSFNALCSDFMAGRYFL